MPELRDAHADFALGHVDGAQRLGQLGARVSPASEGFAASDCDMATSWMEFVYSTLRPANSMALDERQSSCPESVRKSASTSRPP